MFAEERKARIVELVQTYKRIKVNELTEKFRVSESTIRRDLQELEAMGLIKRTHGGAVSVQNTGFEPSFKEKEDAYHKEKEYIGELASKFIEDGDTIILDSGTTTLEIAKRLKGKKVTVLTNSVTIPMELAKSNSVELIVTGGYIRWNTLSMVGPIANAVIKEFRVDKAFIGANGVTIEDGITTPDINEASTKRAMIEVAKEVYLVVDHSKFNKVSFSHIADIKNVDCIITDKEVDKRLIKKYKQLGIELLY